MCSVNVEGDIEDLNSSLTVKLKLFPDKCNKCKEEQPSVVLRNKDFYCKNCFLNNTIHKFKALLGKHRLIKDNDRVLINYKGGQRSTALLHFLRTSLDLNTPKKLRFQPIGLFIEDAIGFSKSTRISFLERAAKEMRFFNIPVYFTTLTQYDEMNKSENLILTENIEDLPIRDEKIDSISHSQTVTNDIKKIHERRLLIHAAKKLNCQFIFTLELSTDTASQLLSNVALGRAAHIPLDTGFCDARDEDVMILRPLRLFDAKELALYNYFKQLEPVNIDYNLTSPSISIQGLIETFVSELQVNYPATVTTVLKTGDKLGIQTRNKGAVNICYICQGPIETVTSHLTSRRAVEFSHQISNKPKTNQDDLVEININDELRPRTCFPCSKIASFLLLPEEQ